VLGPDHASGESGSRRYCGGILLPETGAVHGDTLFAQGRFPAIPFYTGNPWFVPILGRLANVRHSLESALA